MKGIILAGGMGTRLLPFTRVINKHLMPIAGKPMIQYPIETLREAGIKDIIIVTNPPHIEQFKQILGEQNLDVNITYEGQESAAGIADALRQAKDLVGNDKMVVVLGDNVLTESITSYVEEFKNSTSAKILITEVPDPQRFGVAELDGKKVTRIVEKPSEPKSNWAVIGVYMYGPEVFEIIENLEPSTRGEYEITDVNVAYLKKGQLTASKLQKKWIDAGTIDALHEASLVIKGVEK